MFQQQETPGLMILSEIPFPISAACWSRQTYKTH